MPQLLNFIKPSKTRAFTLVEIIFSMVVMGLVAAGIASFYLFALKSTKLGTERAELESNIRRLSNEMLFDVRNASRFVIFETFEAPGRFNPVGAGESGDFLLLYFSDFEGATYKMVGYYISLDPIEPTPVVLSMARMYVPPVAPLPSDDPRPIRRFEVFFDPPLSDYTVAPIPPESTMDDHKLLINAARGLKQGSNTAVGGHLFLNNNSSQIFVEGLAIKEDPTNLESGPDQIDSAFSFGLVPWTSD